MVAAALASLFLLLAPFHANGQTLPHVAPDYHIRLALSTVPLNEAFARLHRSRYSAHFQGPKGPPAICTSGRLYLTSTEALQLNLSGWLNTTSGRHGLNAKADMKWHVTTENCFSKELNIPVTCAVASSAGPVNEVQPIQVLTECEVPFILFVGVLRYQAVMVLDQLVRMDRQITVELADDAKGDEEATTLEFGELKDDKWIPAQEPKKRVVPLSFTIAGLDVHGGTLAVDVTVGDRIPRRLYPDEQAAKRAVENKTPVSPEVGHFGVSIREGFFGSTKNAQYREGLFNALLPIRVRGKKKISNAPRYAEYEVILDGAWVEFGPESMRVTFSTSSARIWETDGAVELRTGFVRAIDVSLELSAPVFNEKSQAFEVAVKDFRIKLDCCIGFANIAIDAKDLAKSINKGLIGLAQTKENVFLGLPACIEIGGSGSFEITAMRPCPDGGTVNRLSLDDLSKNSTLKADFSKGKFSFVEDAFQFSVPVQVEPMR